MLQLTQSSSIMIDKTNVNISESTTVKIVNFVEILRAQKKPVALLKIDIEGAEGMLLDKILDEHLENRFLCCFVETHIAKVPSSAPYIQSIRAKIKARNIKHIFLDWK